MKNCLWRKLSQFRTLVADYLTFENQEDTIQLSEEDLTSPKVYSVSTSSFEEQEEDPLELSIGDHSDHSREKITS